ncbi:hypothetical protein L6Q21_13085 [Sandaracinobacter sp. RS1-74]|uniref:hypothetical protein n=1 Tax=Sandaracinobacteroides sayramensis TaxID=2913411 RepID=UPI001EDBF4FE|nr:hypothetical protein [Sandaracinobacteroides sayramensis]MCG2841917.1 hypothetical protein [Sandaracinobacteroides sayramensis]
MIQNLECVAVHDPTFSQPPCPAGYQVAVVEREFPHLVEDWGSVAAYGAGAVLVMFAIGLALGSLFSILRKSI